MIGGHAEIYKPHGKIRLPTSITFPEKSFFYRIYWLTFHHWFCCFGRLCSVGFWRFTPSSKAIANSRAWFGSLGSLHKFACTVLLLIRRMNMSKTRVFVISPKSHNAASPLSACQNCENDSPGCWVLKKNYVDLMSCFAFFWSIRCIGLSAAVPLAPQGRVWVFVH